MSQRPCHGITKTGAACKAQALKGSDYCRRHQPAESADTSDGSRTRSRNEMWDRDAFLGAFEYTGMVSEACKMAGISRQTAYAERQRNEEFAVRWAEVEERVVETMEQEAYRRAVDGVEKPLVSAGKLVTHAKEYSDSLLMFLLKARRPERYRDRVDVAHSGGVEQRIRVDLSKLDDSELEALERIAGKLEEAA